ncbi:MAG: hypothetical protein EOO75_07405 [Myxococcales bacterium]|nr:MAG: hypothetical protein EOO75_07405 [Myxococcales bacterium]
MSEHPYREEEQPHVPSRRRKAGAVMKPSSERGILLVLMLWSASSIWGARLETWLPGVSLVLLLVSLVLTLVILFWAQGGFARTRQSAGESTEGHVTDTAPSGPRWVLRPPAIGLIFVGLLGHEENVPLFHSWLVHVPWLVRAVVIVVVAWDLWRWGRQWRDRTE